jgi:two-component system NarL family sensor kinase
LLSLVDIDRVRRITALEQVPVVALSASAEPEAITTDPSPSRELEAAVLEHARRGVRLQVLLRGVMVLFALLTVAIVPPVHNSAGCDAIAAAYAAWAIAVGVWGWRGSAVALRLVWVALFADLIALAALTLLAGASARESWTADVLVNGFFLVPLLAATQLRPDVCAAVVAPTVAMYFLSSALTKSANVEPWDSIALRTLVLAGLAGGCVVLSWIQRSRVATISRLVRDRTSLLSELLGTEDRERRTLAEHLHDGALQYVLAARHDLEDARDLADPAAFDRLDQALGESSRLLRSTVGELHPAVLEQAGLARALRELAERTGTSGGLTVALDLDGWDPELRTPADRLLYGTARELLANVVKHADARSARITLAHNDGYAGLTVADDGRGIPDGAIDAALGEGHIGLASYRVRVEAAGGRLTISGARPSGTIARVELPVGPTTEWPGQPERAPRRR